MAKHFKRNKKNKRKKGQPEDLRHKMKRTQSGTAKIRQNRIQDNREGYDDVTEEVESGGTLNTRLPDELYEDNEEVKEAEPPTTVEHFRCVTEQIHRQLQSKIRKRDCLLEEARQTLLIMAGESGIIRREDADGTIDEDNEIGENTSKTCKKQCQDENDSPEPDEDYDLKSKRPGDKELTTHQLIQQYGSKSPQVKHFENTYQKLKNEFLSFIEKYKGELYLDRSSDLKSEQIGELRAQVLKNCELKSELLKDYELESKLFNDHKIKSELKHCDFKSKQPENEDFKTEQPHGHHLKYKPLRDLKVQLLKLLKGRRMKRSRLKLSMDRELKSERITSDVGIQELSALLTAFEISWRTDFLRGYVGQISRLEDRVKAMLLCPQLERMYLMRYRNVLEYLRRSPTVSLLPLKMVYDRLEQALHLTDERRFHLDQEQERQEILATRHLYERERERFLLMFPGLEPSVKTIQQVELEASNYNQNKDDERYHTNHIPTHQNVPSPVQLLPGVRDFIRQAQKTPRPEYYNLFEPIEEPIGPSEDQFELSKQKHVEPNPSDTLRKDDHNKDECPKITANPSSYTSYKCTMRNDESSPNNSSKNLLNSIFSSRICLPKEAVTPNYTIFSKRMYNSNHVRNSPNSNRFNDPFHSSDTSNTSNKICEAIHSTNNNFFRNRFCDPSHETNNPNDKNIFSNRICDSIHSKNVPNSKNILNDLFNKNKNVPCTANCTNISGNTRSTPDSQTQSREEMRSDVIHFFRQYEQLYSTRREAATEPSLPPWSSPEYTSRSYSNQYHRTSSTVESQPNTLHTHDPTNHGRTTQETTTRADHISKEFLDNNGNMNEFLGNNEHMEKFYGSQEYMKFLSSKDHINKGFPDSHELTDDESLSSQDQNTTDRTSHSETVERKFFRSEVARGKHSVRSLGNKRKLPEGRRTVYKTLTKKISRDKILPYKILTRGKTLEDFILESGAHASSVSPTLRPAKSVQSIGEYANKHRYVNRCFQNRTTSSKLSVNYVSTVSRDRKSSIAKSESNVSSRTTSSYNGRHGSSETSSQGNNCFIDKNMSIVLTNENNTHFGQNCLMNFIKDHSIPKDVSRSLRNIRDPMVDFSTVPSVNQENEFLQTKENAFDRFVSKEWETGSGDDLTDKRYTYGEQNIFRENDVFTQVSNNSDRLIQSGCSSVILNQSGFSSDILNQSGYNSHDEHVSHYGETSGNILTQAVLKSAMDSSEVFKEPSEFPSRDNQEHIPQEERAKWHNSDSQLRLTTWKSNLFRASRVKTLESGDDKQVIGEVQTVLSTPRRRKDSEETQKCSESSVSPCKTIKHNDQDLPMSVRRTKEPTFDCLSRFKTNLTRRISFSNRADSCQREQGLHIPLQQRPKSPVLHQSEPDGPHAQHTTTPINPMHRSEKMKLALNAAYESPQAKYCDDFHFPSVRETLKRFRIYRHWDRTEMKTDRQIIVERQMRRMGPRQLFKYRIL